MAEPWTPVIVVACPKHAWRAVRTVAGLITPRLEFLEGNIVAANRGRHGSGASSRAREEKFFRTFSGFESTVVSSLSAESFTGRRKKVPQGTKEIDRNRI